MGQDALTMSTAPSSVQSSEQLNVQSSEQSCLNVMSVRTVAARLAVQEAVQEAIQEATQEATQEAAQEAIQDAKVACKLCRRESTTCTTDHGTCTFTSTTTNIPSCMPTWQSPSPRYCSICASVSSFFLRRSHCRVCGRSACLSCVSDGDEAWLRAPYVQLCSQIPSGHAGRMRVCVECRQRCVAREQEWAWSRILVDLLPFGVHVREWDRLSQLGQPSQMAKTLVHDAKQELCDTHGTFALQQCASRFAARFRWLTSHGSNLDASCHQNYGPSCHQGYGPNRRGPIFHQGTGSSLSLLDKALVAADTGTVHVLDAVHRTPKFLTLSHDAASAMLGNLAVHDALCVLQVPQPCSAVASCCGVSDCKGPDSRGPDSKGSNPRTRSPDSRGPNLVRAEFVSGLPLCAASNRKAIVAYMSPPQKMSAACVHGRIAIDALALSNPQAAAEMREKVGALLDTLAFVGRGRQVDGKRVQSCTLSSCNSLNSSKSLNASKSQNAQNAVNHTQMKSDHAGSVFAGGAIRRMTKVEWLDFPQNRVASVACVPTARLLIWLECVDPRIVRASAFAAPEMYQSLFRSTILSDQTTTEHATTEHETQPVLKPVLKSVQKTGGVETEKEKANKDEEAIVASIVLTVKQGTALNSYTTTHEFRDAYIGARDCGTGTKEIEPQKMQQVQMQQEQVQPVQVPQVATTYTNIAHCATPESMFVQSLLLTILQLQIGQFIDRANAKFLVDNTGTLLCYKAPLLPKTDEPTEPSNEEPSNEEPSHNANQEHQPSTETFALSAEHRLKVRHAISTFISQHAANAAWLGLLLTSSATSSSATSSATSSARPIRRIKADSPLIFVI